MHAAAHRTFFQLNKHGIIIISLLQTSLWKQKDLKISNMSQILEEMFGTGEMRVGWGKFKGNWTPAVILVVTGKNFRPELQRLWTHLCTRIFSHLALLNPQSAEEDTLCQDWKKVISLFTVKTCNVSPGHELSHGALLDPRSHYHLTEPSAGFELLRAYGFTWLGSLQNRYLWSILNKRPEKQLLSPLPPLLQVNCKQQKSILIYLCFFLSPYAATALFFRYIQEGIATLGF